MPVATSIALAGLAVSAASTGMSFAQAGKQKQLQRKAQEDAAQALSEAKKKLDINFYDQMAVKKEPYELEREALLSQGQQAIQAGVESERGAAATAGRVQMAMNEGQAGIRTAMGREMTDIEKLQLAEDSRLRDAKANLDLAEAQGAQQAAHDAGAEAARATAQGMAGLTSMAQQGLNLVPLYGQSAAAKQYNNLAKDYQKSIDTGTLRGKFMDAKGNPLPFDQALVNMSGAGIDTSALKGMNPMQIQAYLTTQNPSMLKSLSSMGFKGPIIERDAYNQFQVNPFEQNMFPQ